LLAGFTVLAIIGVTYVMQFQDTVTDDALYTTVTPDRGDVVQAVATSGSVQALITVEVGSQLSGQLQEIFVDFNDVVKEGDLIALIDQQTFKTRVAQSEADLQVAESNVDMRKASIERTRANLKQARLEYERQKPLSESGTVSESAFDVTVAKHEALMAELDMENAQLKNAFASVEQRKAGLLSATIDLDRTQIRAPIDGVVIERSVDVGQTVAASLSAPVLFQIAQDLRDIQIEADVDEADIGNVEQGNAVSFTVDAYPDRVFDGGVGQVRLAPKSEQNVITYTVIITAKNSDRKLLPGMTATVEIVTGEANNVMRIANDAFRFRPAVEEEPAQAGGGVRIPGSGGGGGGGGFGMGGGGATPGGQTNARGGEMGGGSGIDAEVMASVGVDEDTVQAITAEMNAQIAVLRSELSGGGDVDGLREKFTQVRNSILERYLTPSQLDQVAIKTPAREGGGGRGQVTTVYLLNVEGEVEERSISIGVSDDRFTEVRRGLSENDQVITRMRRTSSG
jgi:HlyD family secretion protein